MSTVGIDNNEGLRKYIYCIEIQNCTHCSISQNKIDIQNDFASKYETSKSN